MLLEVSKVTKYSKPLLPPALNPALDCVLAETLRPWEGRDSSQSLWRPRLYRVSPHGLPLSRGMTRVEYSRNNNADFLLRILVDLTESDAYSSSQITHDENIDMYIITTSGLWPRFRFPKTTSYLPETIAIFLKPARPLRPGHENVEGIHLAPSPAGRRGHCHTSVPFPIYLFKYKLSTVAPATPPISESCPSLILPPPPKVLPALYAPHRPQPLHPTTPPLLPSRNSH